MGAWAMPFSTSLIKSALVLMPSKGLPAPGSSSGGRTAERKLANLPLL